MCSHLCLCTCHSIHCLLSFSFWDHRTSLTLAHRCFDVVMTKDLRKNRGEVRLIRLDILGSFAPGSRSGVGYRTSFIPTCVFLYWRLTPQSAGTYWTFHVSLLNWARSEYHLKSETQRYQIFSVNFYLHRRYFILWKHGDIYAVHLPD